MVKCPNVKCKETMTLHESMMNGRLTWVCYKCGQIGLPVVYDWKIH